MAPSTASRPVSASEIAPGAFSEHLRSRPVVPVYLQHAHDAGPIGSARAWSDAEGVRFRAKLYLEDSERARTTYRAAIDGAITEVSVGFRALSTKDKGNVVVVRRAELRELSLVLVGANPGAVIESVRARHAHERSAALAQKRLLKLIREAAQHEPSGSAQEAVYTLMERSAEFRQLVREARQ